MHTLRAAVIGGTAYVSTICNTFVEYAPVSNCTPVVQRLPVEQLGRLHHLVVKIPLSTEVLYGALIEPFLARRKELVMWTNYINILSEMATQKGVQEVANFCSTMNSHVDARVQSVANCSNPHASLEVAEPIAVHNDIKTARKIGKSSLQIVGQNKMLKTPTMINKGASVCTPNCGCLSVGLCPCKGAVSCCARTGDNNLILVKLQDVQKIDVLSIIQQSLNIASPPIPPSSLVVPNVHSSLRDENILNLKDGLHEASRGKIVTNSTVVAKEWEKDQVAAYGNLKYHKNNKIRTMVANKRAGFMVQVLNRVIGIPTIKDPSLRTGNPIFDNALYACGRLVKASKDSDFESVFVHDACSTPEFVAIDQLKTKISSDNKVKTSLVTHFKNWRDSSKEYLYSLYREQPGYLLQQDFIRRSAETISGPESFTEWSVKSYDSLFGMSVALGPLDSALEAEHAKDIVKAAIEGGLEMDSFKYLLEAAKEEPKPLVRVCNLLNNIKPHAIPDVQKIIATLTITNTNYNLKDISNQIVSTCSTCLVAV